MILLDTYRALSAINNQIHQLASQYLFIFEYKVVILWFLFDGLSQYSTKKEKVESATKKKPQFLELERPSNTRRKGISIFAARG
jgi:hypothetical protein